MKVQNATIESVINTLKSQYGFSFVMRTSDINLQKRVTVNVTDAAVNDLLTQVFAGQDVAINITDNGVIQVSRKQSKSYTVAGKVVDENNSPVAGAVIFEQGTSNGTGTNVLGEYTIKLTAQNATLEASCLGYKSVQQTVNAATQSILDFHMESLSQMMTEVVVIGYGVQNKRDVTTSISSIKSEDIQKATATDFRSAMAARMPGVQVLQNSGGPDDSNVSIRIRGISSATSGNEPLYVIDGVPSDARSFTNISSSDIESIEVLKDASSAAIYGSRGSGGVVMVTTKLGKSEKPTVSFDTYFGIQQVSKKMALLDAWEYAAAAKDGHDGSYLTDVPTGSASDPNSVRPQTYHQTPTDLLLYMEDTNHTLTNTDWQDAIFRTAKVQNHSLSVSAKNKNVNYYVGANYLKREGIIIGSDFERYGIRLNLEGKRNRLKYGVNFSPSYSKSNNVDANAQYGSDGVLASALMTPPNFSIYNEDGSYNWDMNGKWRIGTDMQHNETLNPVALALEIDNVTERVTLMGNAWTQYDFTPWLSYKISIGGDFYTYTNDKYRPSYLPLRGWKYYDAASNPIGSHTANSYYNWNIENQLSFNRTFGDHSINAVAVYQSQKQNSNTSVVTGTGYPDDKIRTISGATEIVASGTSQASSGWTMASALARVQYSYKGRYMASAAIRADGSSRFGKDNRWGYFPSASLGWRVSDEEFLKPVTWLNDMKLRASYGVTGNYQIGNYEHLALLNSLEYVTGAGDGQLTSGYYPTSIQNDQLTWETVKSFDVGLDFTTMKGYFGMTIDYYYSRTTNMLFDVPVSSVSGMTQTQMNIGSMQNKGIELGVNSSHSFKGFTYQVAANITFNRNKVLHLGAEDAPIIKESSYAGGYYITQVGQPVGSYYLLVQDGIFHNEEELKQYPHFSNTHVGDFRYVDVDGDGVMDPEKDRMIVGNYMPDFYYGFSANLGYKGIDMSIAFQGVYGNEILNLERRYILNMEGSANMMKEALQRYPYGELNRGNRKSTGRNGASTSTFHIEDGSYLRLQNIQLGYTFPARWMAKANISRLRVYAQGSNLFTWTKYTGFNPEVNRRPSDALRPGEDYCSYPLAKTFTFGINFNF